MIYIIIFLCISNLISLIYFYKERKKSIKERKKNQAEIDQRAEDRFSEIWKEKSRQQEIELAQKKSVAEAQIKSDLEKETRIANLQKQNLQNQIQSQYNQLETLKEGQEQTLREHQKKVEIQITAELNQRKAKEFDDIVADIEALLSSAAAQKSAAQAEIDEILDQLAQYKKKRDAINEQIRIENEAQNNFDMHRIVLSDNAIEDIHFLKSIEDKIHNKELLHKLIWTEYLQKPFNLMLKNIFGSNIPKNVIYCIENHNTHKKYIGKTSGLVSNRWTEHIKTSLNIGSIKKNYIHQALDGHWDEFSFSIIEVVSDNVKLGDREKYYISFFESDKYGYNEKSGG